MSELAIREYGKPKGLDFIAEIRRAGTNLLSIINDILDFSKIETGSLTINRAPYDTASLLNDALAIIHVRMKEKPIRLISEIDPELPAALEGDETRVRQVLLNLLSNAVKYTREGFIKFRASGERTGDGRINLTFGVEDSGIGIKPEDIGKLFGDFVRVDQSRNTSVEGSGLGLAIARSLCRAMGGDISVESEYGKGSLFTAKIAQTIADDRPLGDIGGKIGAAMEHEDVRFTAPGVRALLVDDIATNLMVIKGLLAPYGMDVSECLNGREAIDLVGRESFDIVFMDHMMPEMNGLEATAAIRAMRGEYFKNIPIIALTANAISGMREMFLQNGFNDYLAKPIEIQKLNEIMDRWIPKEKRAKSTKSERRPLASVSLPETGVKIEGIDAARGIAMTGGSAESYIKVLETYCRDAAKRVEILSNTPDEKSLALFTTQVHALKSASGSIGASALSKKAAMLEEAGKRGDIAAISEGLDGFREDLSQMVERIRHALSLKAAVPENGGSVLDKTTLLGLKEALEARDIRAIDEMLGKLTNSRTDGEIAPEFSRISDCVLISDFDEAGKIIDGLMKDTRRDG
jgi:CheY-like chemotaxis protein